MMQLSALELCLHFVCLELESLLLDFFARRQIEFIEFDLWVSQM